ncbi:MAG: 23S rRNA (uracil(1939)-C(5))-methyltransferase RlmD [Candidatus Sumerlaeia bacterium]|nr:23S rRNA (uracil(1939)-C(5))-methyltransferase RlmD [Candidatus Sumerlaeia bacterium]
MVDDRKQSGAARPKKGGEAEVVVESLAFGGAGVARADGFVLFVPHTAPGDRLRVVVTKSKGSWGEARGRELLEAGPARVEPLCPLVGTCGGCNWQHVSIEAQREAKERIVRDALRQIAGLADAVVEPLVESPDTWRYRNKMEFTFGASRLDGGLVAGFHEAGNWRHILDAERCWLAPESMERALRAAVAEGARQGLSAWCPHEKRGTLRQLVVRHSVHEDALLALLLTGDESLDFPAFAAALRSAEPSLKAVVWGLNARDSDVARAERVLATDGDAFLEERLGGLRFRISPASFFQSNTRGAERLYEVVRGYASLTGAESVLDAYCGTGTIAQYCAPAAREVLGLELLTEAVWDARENAERNGLANCRFVSGDIRHTLPVALGSMPGRIDRVIVDPPRGGMERKALEQLLAIRAPVFVYVSCNPTTMARDLQQALEAGYRLDRVRPVDMFPQTYHVEAVARLVLGGGA